MIYGDLARFNEAWNEAVSQDDNRFWKRLRRSCQDLAQKLLSRGRLRESGNRKRDEFTELPSKRVITRDGHVLEIDPRCDDCRETFRI